MKIISNPMRDFASAESRMPDAAKAARKALSRWPAYSVTPLLSLDQLAKDLDLGCIWLKDEGSRFGIGSFKALGAAYALESLLRSKRLANRAGDGTGEQTISCASDGNYGRAVAWAAQRLGCRCIVYLPSHVTEYRREAIHQFGARTVRVHGTYNLAEAEAKRAAARNGWLLASDSSDGSYTQFPRNVMAGYGVMLSEIGDTILLESITHVLLQCGVGAFAGAVCDYLHSYLGRETPHLVSVEPEAAACVFASVKHRRATIVGGGLTTIMGGLACGRPSPIAWDVLRTRLDYCTTLHDSWAEQAVRLLHSGRASGQSVVAGETGAAGLGALLCAAKNERSRRQLGLDASSKVLLFCTEGATDPEVYRKIVGEPAHCRSNLDAV